MAEPTDDGAARGPVPGSPQWWATRHIQGPQPRRGRPPRSLDEIIDAATELVDEAGQDGFSMRALAVRLGTSTATLYRHLGGKDAVMVLVVEHFLRGLTAVAPPAADQPPDWKDAARDAAVFFRYTLAQHPNFIPLLVAQIPIGPHGLAMRERVIETLVNYGFPTALAARAYTTLAHYVIGFVAQEHAPGAPGPNDSAALGEYYRSLDPEHYPSTVAAADALTTVDADDEFLEGLNYLLDGINRAWTGIGAEQHPDRG